MAADPGQATTKATGTKGGEDKDEGMAFADDPKGFSAGLAKTYQRSTTSPLVERFEQGTDQTLRARWLL